MNDTADPVTVTADDIVDAFWRLAEAAAIEQWRHRRDLFGDEPEHRLWLTAEGEDDDDLDGDVSVDPRGVFLTIGITNPYMGRMLTDGYGRMVERHRQEDLAFADGLTKLADEMRAGGFATLGDMMAARRVEQQASDPAPSA